MFEWSKIYALQYLRKESFQITASKLRSRVYFLSRKSDKEKV